MSPAVLSVMRSRGGNQSPPPLREIEDAVAKVTGISIEVMRGRGRRRDVSRARHTVWLLARDLTAQTLSDIGRQYGRDHTTVMWGVEKATEHLREGMPEYRRVAREARAILDAEANWEVEVVDPGGDSSPGVRITYERPDGTSWVWIGLMRQRRHVSDGGR
jgi:hypothetical protein